VILGGSDLAGPSPGHVDLTPVAGGKFQVDSFFDVSYSITYSGCVGGLLEGLDGTTDVESVHMEAVSNSDPVPALGPVGITLLVLGLGAMSIRRLHR
jgi:hypothetical protein